MISAPTLRLIGLAIAGILVAAAVAVAASQLASRQIGLASEPVSAGDELAPPAARPHHEGERQGGEGKEATSTTPTTGEETDVLPPSGETEIPSNAEPSSPSDDSSSGGEGGSHGDD